MADIDVKPKGPTIWPWIVGLLVLALIAWGAAEVMDNDDVADATTYTSVPVAAVEPADTVTISMSQILANPAAFVGRSFPAADVDVVDVPTDRGFWIERNGERLFAILVDQPKEVPVDINAGQSLRIEGGTLRDAAYLSDIPGETLDADTRALAKSQAIFLVVNESAIQMPQDTRN